MEEKISFNIENLIIGGAIGLGIGYILGYAVAKKTIGPTLTGTLDSQSLNQLNTGIQELNNKLDEIKMKLGIPSPLVQSQYSSQYPYSMQQNSMQQIQENDEDFELKTNERGRMVGFKAHRSLYQNKDE